MNIMFRLYALAIENHTREEYKQVKYLHFVQQGQQFTPLFY